jgi:hypothetical protein
MKNHEEDLMLMSNFIIRELKQRKNREYVKLIKTINIVLFISLKT